MKALPPSIRLTREQFRAVARAKGWKFKMLAERWAMTPEWISNISRDPARDLRFDDALLGLPNLHHLARDLRQRERSIADAVAGESRRPAGGARQKAVAPGYRYRGYLIVGAILTASTQFGSVAEEGERGIVFHVDDTGQGEVYGVIFENGAHDWFEPSHVDAYLATTGIIAPEADRYHYQDAPLLQADFNAGRFYFWPVPRLPT